MKTSPYKETILKLFSKAHVLSISEIHKKIPKADFSTIFRNVEQLYLAGNLKKILVDMDTVVYELNEKNHAHDHFVCTDCGEVDAIHLEHEKIHLPGKSSDFEVVVRGVCGDCCK